MEVRSGRCANDAYLWELPMHSKQNSVVVHCFYRRVENEVCMYQDVGSRSAPLIMSLWFSLAGYLAPTEWSILPRIIFSISRKTILQFWPLFLMLLGAADLHCPMSDWCIGVWKQLNVSTNKHQRYTDILAILCAGKLRCTIARTSRHSVTLRFRRGFSFW